MSGENGKKAITIGYGLITALAGTPEPSAKTEGLPSHSRLPDAEIINIDHRPQAPSRL